MKGKESAGNKLLQSQKGKTGSAHASVEKNVPKFDKNKFSGFLKEINERSRQGLDQLSRRKPNQPDSQGRRDGALVTLENVGAKILNRRGKEIQRKNLELAIESCMNLVHCNQQKTLHHKSPHRTPRKDKSEEEDGGGSEEEVRSRRKSKRRPALRRKDSFSQGRRIMKKKRRGRKVEASTEEETSEEASPVKKVRKGKKSGVDRSRSRAASKVKKAGRSKSKVSNLKKAKPKPIRGKSSRGRLGRGR